MSSLAFNLLCAIAGVALAIPLSLMSVRRMRTSKRWAGSVAFTSALFFAFEPYSGRNRALVEEAMDETKSKKDERSGDPPVPRIDADR